MTAGGPIERRASDARLTLLERDMSEVLVTVKSIDAALKYPEQSPLGRTLSERSEANRAAIRALEESDDRQNAVINELNGVAKAMRIVALLVGLAVSLLTLATILGR